MLTREAIKEIVLSTMHEVADMSDNVVLIDPIKETSVLLETGLDSLGFATVVAALDFKLDYDPFSLCQEAIYPRIFKEFIDFYLQYQPKC